MRDWLMTSSADRQVLEAAARYEENGGTLRPWRGSFARAARLCKGGMLQKAGISAMPPYVLYVITPKGREELEVAKAVLQS